MSIPRIAISNEDDASLRILETRPRIHTFSNSTASPYKSIIKTRSSQPQSPSSSATSQSFHTCFGSTQNESFEPSPDFPVPLKRSYTIAVVKNPLDNTIRKRPASFHKSRPYSTIEGDSSLHENFLNPERPLRKRSNTQEETLTDSRQSTIDESTNPIIQIETPSVYGTPEHHEQSSLSDNSIRLVVDTDSTMQAIINDQSDMQVDITGKEKAQKRIGVS